MDVYAAVRSRFTECISTGGERMIKAAGARVQRENVPGGAFLLSMRL